MSTIGVGNASESLVLAAYVREGFAVSIPFGNGCAYDLIVDTGSRLLKVQVKTGWQRRGCLFFKGQRRVRASMHNGMRQYREDEVDFFAVCFRPHDAIYVLPCRVVTGDCRLRLSPAVNGQQRLIRWAADFTWEKHVGELRRDGLEYGR